MLVLRLENDYGKGVFQDGGIYDMYQHLSPDSGAHMSPSPNSNPNPWGDRGLMGINCDQFCGFKDWEQYRLWFTHPDMDEALAKCGVQMSTYEVRDDLVKVGQFQVLFLKCAAIKVDRQPCCALRPEAETTAFFKSPAEFAWRALAKLEGHYHVKLQSSGSF